MKTTINQTMLKQLLALAPNHYVDKTTKIERYAHSREVKNKHDVYTLESVDFDLESRNAVIVFCETKTYRTVEKYESRDGVKYPILSPWKTKEKKTTKRICLNNVELEQLNKNDDFLIKKFAPRIVLELREVALIPSWMMEDYYKREKKKEAQKLKKSFEETTAKLSTNLAELKEKIANYEEKLKAKNEEKNALVSKLDKTTTTLQKVASSKDNLALSILTLGIYDLYKSDYHKSNLGKKKNELETQLAQVEDSIKTLSESISSLQDKYSKYEDEIIKAKVTYKYDTEDLKKKLKHQVSSIVKLSDNALSASEFTPLKLFGGFNYSQIIGCLVIKNTENGKCYVEQAFSVLKRLNRFFDGTVPSKVKRCFYEDYMASKLANKQDLFSVRIVPCYSKNDLDSREKELIAMYKADKTGYNAK